MAETSRTHRFSFEAERTCKIRWAFRLSEGPDGPLVEEVEIVGHKKTPESREHGCLGHPGTIAALLRGRAVRSLPLDELEASPCVRERSCGHVLAECLRRILAESAH